MTRGFIEHHNEDGSIVRIHPSEWEDKWGLHTQGTTMSYQENILAAANLLSWKIDSCSSRFRLSKKAK